MPKFSNSYSDATFAGMILKEERKTLFRRAGQVITICNATPVNGQLSNAFLKTLSGYLEQRRNEIHLFSFNNSQLRSRTELIRRLIPLIQNNDVDRQIELLNDENIRHFKGFFSQRLYNLLVARRMELLSQVTDESPAPYSCNCRS